MFYFILKTLITALIIVAASEVAKRNIVLGGLIVAMPLSTILATFWLYYDKKDLSMLSDFLVAVILGVLISFLFFIPAIYLFKKGMNFYLVMLISTTILAIGAFLYQNLSTTKL